MIIAVHVQDVPFSQIVQWYYLRGHETVTTEHLWWSHQIVLNNRKIMALCAQGGIPSLTFRDYYLHDRATVTAEHLWGSHLFVSRAWKVPLDSLKDVLRHYCSCKGHAHVGLNGFTRMLIPRQGLSVWVYEVMHIIIAIEAVRWGSKEKPVKQSSEGVQCFHKLG